MDAVGVAANVSPEEQPPSRTIQVPVQAVQRPKRSADLEPVGRMQGTAYGDDQWLLCYRGTDYIQATTLLYHVLLFADGKTPLDEIAWRVLNATGVELTSEQVEWLVVNRLIPSGMLEIGDDDEMPAIETPGPQLLGIRYRLPLLPYRVTAPLVNVLQHLFWPPLMLPVIAFAVAINLWIFFNSGLVSGLQTMLFRPELVLLLLGISIASVLFHELGHASALRRSGCRHGTIGLAVYVIWPVLYTDVTHVYRLSRRERLRVDLGGMYFQLVGMIVLFGVYVATDAVILLVAIALTTFAFLQQFTPFLRFDGYYVIADIMGVHEPLSLVGPFIREHLPWRRHRRTSELPALRPVARVAFTGYLFLVVAFLAYPFIIGAFAGTAFITGLIDGGRASWEGFTTAVAAADPVLIVLAVVQLVSWFLIVLGLALFAFSIVRHVSRGLIALVSLLLRRVRRAPTAA